MHRSNLHQTRILLKRYISAVALLFGLPLLLHGQDTRHVTEPVISSTCTVLKARLQATDNALREEDEKKLDSARIQKAMDHCGAGKAVVLKADGASNAFLSGPLELRNGVTLLIEKA